MLSSPTSPTPLGQVEFATMAAECDVGVCAVDNEPAKYAFDATHARRGQAVDARRSSERWDRRLGSPIHARRAVLRLRRQPPSAHRDRSATRTDAGLFSARRARYRRPPSPLRKASIAAIAALHAVVTLECSGGGTGRSERRLRLLALQSEAGGGSLRRTVPIVSVPYSAFADLSGLRTTPTTRNGRGSRCGAGSSTGSTGSAMIGCRCLACVAADPSRRSDSRPSAEFARKLPVPWSADAVIVEVLLHLPPPARRKSDFTILFPHGEPILADALRPEAA